MTSPISFQCLVVVATDSGLQFHARPLRPANLLLGGQAFATFRDALASLTETQRDPTLRADLALLRQTAEACDWNELQIASVVLDA